MANDSRLDPAVERRASKRFRIEQGLTYKTVDHRAEKLEAGTGTTVNFSSRGVLFRTEHGARLHVGQRVEISVFWPALLSGTCPLKFVALGQVLRVDNELVAASIQEYEFRTRRVREWPIR